MPRNFLVHAPRLLSPAADQPAPRAPRASTAAHLLSLRTTA